MEVGNLAPANLGVLPQELLSDILLRLPAKEIGRHRAVCQPWRNLTSDPSFIKAHADRHPEQFVVASFDGDSEHIHVMDLSGRVVKRLPFSITEGKYFLRSCPDIVGVGDVDGSCCLIDPVSGVVSHLPKTVLKLLPDTGENCYSSDSWDSWDSDDDGTGTECCVFVAGRVDSTGEYKVLRLVCEPYMSMLDNFGEHQHPVSSVLTINGGDGAQWRATQSYPEFPVSMHYMESVLVGSTVHFYCSNSSQRTHCIASFDLEAEEWTSTPGPCPPPGDEDDTYSMYYDSTLAALNGNLVVVHYRGYFETMDLWFLTDIENRQWEKKYSICTESVLRSEEFAKPLLLLDDGRIVIFLGAKGVLLLYDPTNNVVSEVGTKRLGGVAMYGGSLLSLRQRGVA